MTSYATEIRSTLPPAQAFAYMADFANARVWDPSVSSAARQGEGAIALGTAFDVTTRFARRSLELTYTIVEFEPPVRVVLEARRKFVSRDTVTVAPDGTGSLVRYEAVLAFGPVGRLFHPVMQRVFDRIGEQARAGLVAALNPPV
jgi:hypothetical protein